MAAFQTTQGFACEFLGSVPDYLHCKACNLVARRLTLTSCCGESYCHACIADTQEQGNSCPACEEQDFSIFGHKKNQKQINSLLVCCSIKERGCDWSGTLEQLDTHLDPDQDNCQYVDTKCSLNCLMTIPKNKVEQHVAQHCAKRPYVCQHCNFKATYEEVVDKHLPECKYVPLQCPNLCGVTFERDFMEDHMNMCRLQEVGCEFSGVGCDGRFRREDQEEHSRQNSQKHLTLTAFLAVDTKEQLQQKLLEQDKKHKEEEEKLKQKIEEQQKKIEEQEKKLDDQNQTLKEHEKKLIDQENERKKEEQKLKQKIELNTVQQQKLDEHKQLLFNSKLKRLEQRIKEVVDKSVQNEGNLSKMSSTIYFNRRFEMKTFSHEKAKDKSDDWKSPAMYTHVGGYKFCIGVDANGYGSGLGKSIYVDLFSMPGEYDDQLKWPAKATFTVELINQKGGENASRSTTITWNLLASEYNHICGFDRIHCGFIEHSQLHSFLKNNTLYFFVSEIKIL